MEKSPFLSSVQDYMYQKRYSKRTIESYLLWIKRYILFHKKRHPATMDDTQVEAFLNHLVLERHVAAQTQALALNALSFLYHHILKRPLSLQLCFVKSQRPQKLPVVLTVEEVERLFANISPQYFLPVALLYGSGLRLMEVLRLRVHDIDFDYKCFRIWNGKGGKHRTVTMANELQPYLRNQIDTVEKYLELDLRKPDYDGVWLPSTIRHKCRNAKRELQWHYLFPSAKLSNDPETGKLRRHHIDESGLQKAIRASAQKAKLSK